MYEYIRSVEQNKKQSESMSRKIEWIKATWRR